MMFAIMPYHAHGTSGEDAFWMTGVAVIVSAILFLFVLFLVLSMIFGDRKPKNKKRNSKKK
jgi:hypothetical protein